MTEEDRAIILRRANENLQTDIQNHATKYGWHNTAKVLSRVVFVHVGWDEDFTELDNVLRKIERKFKDKFLETKPDIPIPPLEPPEHSFS